MLFLARYRIVWQATSDKTTSRKKVVIESKSFEDARLTITTVEEAQNRYCRVFFDSLEVLDGVVLWK